MSESKYTGIIQAKNASLIPQANGKNLHSSYNPDREGETFASNAPEGSFFVIGGICGAFHIEALLKRFPESKIIAAEENQESIDFLLRLENVKKLSADPRVTFTEAKNLARVIAETYLPHIDGNLAYLPLRSWEENFPLGSALAKAAVDSALKMVGADFSVQSHFGKIWQKNFFSNLHFLKKSAEKNPKDLKISFDQNDIEKTAAIIAAGPSLDWSYKKIAEKRGEYFVIATDTAYQALAKRGITADACISIDAQFISREHFFSLGAKTLFIFDSCANPQSARRTVSHPQSNDSKTFFCMTGHPLPRLAFQSGKINLPEISSGSGTVTIAAASFALMAGFTRLEFFGADFSYLDGKSYTRGTYLDSIYGRSSSRLNPVENQYDSLLFRTELEKIGRNQFTTKVLASYRASLEEFLRQNGLEKSGDNIWSFPESEKKAGNSTFDLKFGRNSAHELKNFLKAELVGLKKEIKGGNLQKVRGNPAFFSILPMSAFFQRQGAQRDESFYLAAEGTLSYTDLL